MNKITNMDKGEAIHKVKEYKLLLKNYFPLEKDYLFGSYAKNTNQQIVILMLQ